MRESFTQGKFNEGFAHMQEMLSNGVPQSQKDQIVKQTEERLIKSEIRSSFGNRMSKEGVIYE